MPGRYPKADRTTLRVEELGDELLVYDLVRHRAHCLNASAATVFRLADGRTSPARMAEELAARHGLPADEEIVALALDELRRLALLEPAGAEAPTAPSRRSMLKHLGAIAASLPVIASITVPRPAAAQSGGTGPGPTGPTGPTGPG